MKMLHVWKTTLFFLTSMVLSLVGMTGGNAGASTSSAVSATKMSQQTETASVLPDQPTTTAQNSCPYGGAPRLFARVTTSSTALNVRTSPNGRIVGAIPKNWEVVVVDRDRTGQWTRIKNHFDIDMSRFSAFGSAEAFRDGWVSSRFLRDLGRFCDKPYNDRFSLKALLGYPQALIRGDWLQWGDRIAKSIHNPQR